ncbi:hypothetical protein OROGR_015848 [Orobanche gracilis]
MMRTQSNVENVGPVFIVEHGGNQIEMKTICDSLGVKLISYSPLELGMLTRKYTHSNLPSGPRGFCFDKFFHTLKQILEKGGGKQYPSKALG